MLPFALILILVAAFLHAGWNVLVKVSKNALALMWWASLLGAAGYGVWLVVAGPGIYLSSASWLPFLVSAAAETGYFVTLVRGYQMGDLSLVYPISRGSAPIFAAIWSALILGERLPALGYVGIALIVGGICVVSIPPDGPSLSALASTNLHSLFRSGAVNWALACAIFISIFSVSDKVVVGSTPPLVYIWWVIAGNTALWFPIVWGRSPRRMNFVELRENPWGVIATGIGIISAYGAALVALALTSASYVVAGRGLSVVIGAAFGSLMLKEGFGSARVIGALMMVLGLALIAFA